MALIALHRPVAGHPRLQRVNMFPGRALGETDFDREQDHADARLAPLLRAARPGVVTGLAVRSDAAGEGVTVSPGLAVSAEGVAIGLYAPLRADWSGLIDDYLARTGSDDVRGIHYLTLHRATRGVDVPGVDPCRRTEFDPTRDSRLVVIGRLGLSRLALDPALVDTWPAERIANHVVADRVDGGFLQALGAAVPLALVAIGGEAAAPAVRWISPEAGRYEAVPEAGYRALLDQVSAAMRGVMQRASAELAGGVAGGTVDAFADFLAENLRLDFMPATGQLPLSWLRDPASASPSLLWWPAHVAVDMVPVPEEAVVELLERHLARRVIDLRQPSGERIRLLLAVGEADYRPDLLDIPPTDAALEQDIYRMFMQAWSAWADWRRQFDLLYHLDEAAALDPAAIRALGLPDPEPPPPLPEAVFQRQITEVGESLRGEEGDALPHPYHRDPSAMPTDYRSWRVTVEGMAVPPPVPEPTEDGLVVRYAIGLRELEALDNRIRATRARLEKTRDVLLLQRQQLDSQTVALAALAGGVAGDGSGLKVARWLPFARMDSELPSPPAADAPQPPLSAAPSVTASLGRFATGSVAMMAMPLSTTSVTTAPLTASAFSSTTAKSSPLVGSALFATQTATRSSGPTPVAPVVAGSNTFNTSLLNSALKLGVATSASSALASQPRSFSAIELGIDNARLDLISRVAKETVSTPAFQTRAHQFGVMEHIRPEVNEYAKAFRGMQDLRNTLTDLFDLPDARRLRKSLDLAGALQADGSVTLRPEQLARRLEDPVALERRITADANRQLAAATSDQQRRSWRDVVAVQYTYEALFKAGKILTQWIAIVEARYNGIERRLEGLLREQANRTAELRKLAALIRAARETLEGLDRRRLEQLGEYGLAQRLLDEDWRRCHDRNLERRRILSTGLRGLYYVRPLSAAVSEAPADPLVLRHGRIDDIVPGCGVERDVDLPGELQPFFDTVCEIPMADWAVLKAQVPRLPLDRLDPLSALRKARFEHRHLQPVVLAGAATLQARLAPVQLQNRVVMQHFASAPLPAVDPVGDNRTRHRLASVLSLNDLVAQGTASLRRDAEQLHQRLEQCQYCLLDRLGQLPPSLRLQWAQLAGDGSLRIDEVARWPGLERAERAAFNATRSVAELVAWWFRQLEPDASADSRAAMGNMIRATLIRAALGDPTDIVAGRVRVPPRRAVVGERLQVTLDHALAPGTSLQLLDDRQQLVAMLTVEDRAGEATEVRIAQLLRPGVAIDTRYSVVSSRTGLQRV